MHDGRVAPHPMTLPARCEPIEDVVRALAGFLPEGGYPPALLLKAHAVKFDRCRPPPPRCNNGR